MENTKRKTPNIKEAQRQNEADLLKHIREHRMGIGANISMSWHNALDRLIDAGMVRYKKSGYVGYYVARKYARPVTRS